MSDSRMLEVYGFWVSKSIEMWLDYIFNKLCTLLQMLSSTETLWAIYIYMTAGLGLRFFFLLEDFNHFNTIHNQREYLIFWFQN